MTAKTQHNNCPSVQQVGAEEAPHCVDNVWHYGPKIFLCGPPGYPKTVPIARVNSCRFSIGLWCTSTFRGGSSRRRLALPGGAVSRPHHLRGCRGGPRVFPS